jgi:hypothetical protein
VIEKRPIEKPSDLKTGTPTIPDYRQGILKRLKEGLRKRIYLLTGFSI